jgi:hypothetical protein
VVGAPPVEVRLCLSGRRPHADFATFNAMEDAITRVADEKAVQERLRWAAEDEVIADQRYRFKRLWR